MSIELLNIARKNAAINFQHKINAEYIIMNSIHTGLRIDEALEKVNANSLLKNGFKVNYYPNLKSIGAFGIFKPELMKCSKNDFYTQYLILPALEDFNSFAMNFEYEFNRSNNSSVIIEKIDYKNKFIKFCYKKSNPLEQIQKEDADEFLRKSYKNYQKSLEIRKLAETLYNDSTKMLDEYHKLSEQISQS